MHRQRRSFLKSLASLALAAAAAFSGLNKVHGRQQHTVTDQADNDSITLFLCGDVMTGRGIDQILPHPVHPRLYEPFIRNARAYVNLAEQENGPLPESVAYDYIWGDALDMLGQYAPAARIINLETAVTDHAGHWPGKGIHYRMHPANVPCLTTAGVDCCVLANNHVLDWKHAGLRDTLAVLQEAGIETAGAGLDQVRAAAPAVITLPRGRILVFGFGHPDSGIPGEWQATSDRGGINLLPDLTETTIKRINSQVKAMRRPGDIVIASIHWGVNWGYQIPLEQQRFAHALIDNAGIDIVHGHSSHHPKGIEIYKDRAVLYGCGDFLNDYEGIGGHEEFRSELTLMYFPRLEPGSGRLQRLELVPMRIANFRLHRASGQEAQWLIDMLNREGQTFATRAELTPAGTIVVSRRNTG